MRYIDLIDFFDSIIQKKKQTKKLNLKIEQWIKINKINLYIFNNIYKLSPYIFGIFNNQMHKIQTKYENIQMVLAELLLFYN